MRTVQAAPHVHVLGHALSNLSAFCIHEYHDLSWETCPEMAMVKYCCAFFYFLNT